MTAIMHRMRVVGEWVPALCLVHCLLVLILSITAPALEASLDLHWIEPVGWLVALWPAMRNAGKYEGHLCALFTATTILGSVGLLLDFLLEVHVVLTLGFIGLAAGTIWAWYDGRYCDHNHDH